MFYGTCGTRCILRCGARYGIPCGIRYGTRYEIRYMVQSIEYGVECGKVRHLENIAKSVSESLSHNGPSSCPSRVTCFTIRWWVARRPSVSTCVERTVHIREKATGQPCHGQETGPIDSPLHELIDHVLRSKSLPPPTSHLNMYKYV